jgi:hypothetical protein
MQIKDDRPNLEDGGRSDGRGIDAPSTSTGITRMSRLSADSISTRT